MLNERQRSLAGRRVLIVEDEYLLADELRMNVELAGAEVIGPIATLKEAQTLTHSGIDCAFVDINLRGETAYPLIDQLKSADVQVILVSGYDQESLPKAYRDLPLLQKPVSLQLLTSTCATLGN